MQTPNARSDWNQTVMQLRQTLFGYKKGINVVVREELVSEHAVIGWRCSTPLVQVGEKSAALRGHAKKRDTEVV